MMTRMEGVSFDAVQAPEQARAAAHLLGRFHSALDDLEHEFVGLRTGVHDTPAHLRRLAEAVAERPEHRLHAEVARLAEACSAVTLVPVIDQNAVHPEWIGAGGHPNDLGHAYIAGCFRKAIEAWLA